MPPDAIARLGIGTITAAKLSPDGTKLAVGGSAGVWLIDAATFSQIWATSIPNPVSELVWSPSGHWLGVGLMQLGGMTLDAQTGHEQASIYGFITPFEGFRGIALAISPDDKLVATGGCIELSDLETCAKSAVLVWDNDSGKLVDKFVLDMYWSPHEFIWSPDSKILIAESWDGRTMWDISNLRQISLPLGIADHDVMRVSPDWSQYAHIVKDGVEVNRWPSGRSLLKIPLEVHVTRGGTDATLNWSPDGTKLAIWAGNSFGTTPNSYIFNLSTNTLTQLDSTWLHNNFAWSGSSALFAEQTFTENHFLLWNASRKDAPELVEMPFPYAEPVGFVGNSILLLDNHTSSIVSYDLTSHTIVNRITGTQPFFSVAWSSDGRSLAAGDASHVVVWDPQLSSPIQTCQPQGEYVQGSISPLDGMLGHNIVSGSWAIWNPEKCDFDLGTLLAGATPTSPDGKYKTAVPDNMVEILSSPAGELNAQWKRTLPVGEMAWTPDGSHIIALGGEGDQVEIGIWDFHKQQTVYEKLFQDFALVTAVCCSPDSRQILIFEGHIPEHSLQTFSKLVMSVIDIKTGESLFTRNVIDETPDTTGTIVAWSPDGKIIAKANQGLTPNPGDGASYSRAGTIYARIDLYDARSGHLIKTFRGHTNQIFGIAWSPDGKVLASASADGTIILWNTVNLLNSEP